MRNFVKALMAEENGATMVEYALIGAALVTAVTRLKTAIIATLGTTAAAVSTAGS